VFGNPRVITRNKEKAMSIEGILAAIGGPGGAIVQPEGGSDVTPLSPLGLDQTAAAPAPQGVEPQQGAGSGSGGLYANPGEVADGQVHVGGNRPDSSRGPEQRPVLADTVGHLTAGQVNRPEGGTAPLAAPVGRPDHALGRDQSTGAGLNPALGRMPKVPPGQVQ
jgi:hypothetical protein